MTMTTQPEMTMTKQPQIEHMPTTALIPYARNSRTHSDAQIAQLAASIREFGFNNPVLIDSQGGIIAGHGRVLAAQQIGLGTLPCLRLAHLTEAQKRAYVIADNQLSTMSAWDEEMLFSELDALEDLGVDLSLLGFAEELALDPPDKAATHAVNAIQTRQVFDRFWISIRGPLEHQAHALQRLQTVMAELPLVIELGTVSANGMD